MGNIFSDFGFNLSVLRYKTAVTCPKYREDRLKMLPQRTGADTHRQKHASWSYYLSRAMV